MNLNGVEYFYITNLQGDVIELVDINGNTRVTYKYDAWGNIIDTKEYDSQGNEIALNVANKNPYRYRGYRYDEETGYYYLQSRYYNPEIGRFINADGLVGPQGDILGHNEGGLVVMDIEYFNRREKMSTLREELLAVEEDRLHGEEGYAINEVASLMRLAIKETNKGTSIFGI